MSMEIGVVDYGANNLLSVVSALEYCGAKVRIVAQPEHVMQSQKLVLPGVGAFQKGMAILREKGLITPILDYLTMGRPYLGICLGMQFLFETSYEFGAESGLGVIKGDVVKIPHLTETSTLRRVPHVGWGTINPNKDRGLCPLLDRIHSQKSFYFVHSFMCTPDDARVVSSYVDYEGLPITASISFNNIYGTQFHPEKSGEAGLKILKNFLKIKR